MRSTVDEVEVLDVPATGIQVGPDEVAALTRVIASGSLAQGAEVAAFEEEFAAHVEGRTCVAVNSGTSALLLGLLAIGIGPGDEVIVPSFSFAATANVVVLAGARPVFADIDPVRCCLDPSAVLAAITGRTAAIMPVHLYGHPAPMGRLGEIAAAHGLAVVEDAAQAHLAALDGRPAGTFGAVAGFSFYPTKNMTTGEGGLVVCADEATARRVRLLRNQGMEQRHANEIVGYNMRMSELHAAIGRVQLRRLPGWTEQRRRNATRLTAGLTGVATAGLLGLPSVAPGARPAWHQYTVRSGRRDELVTTLAARGVHTGVYYRTPIHRLPPFRADQHLPHTDAAAAEVLSLPVHPALTPPQLEHVVRAVREAARDGRVA